MKTFALRTLALTLCDHEDGSATNRFRRCVFTAFFVGLTALATPQVSRADGLADEADLHFSLGSEAYRKNDFRTALEHYLASNRLVPNHNVMFNIALTYENLGRYAEAYRYFIDAMERETDAKTLAAIEGKLKDIAPKVAVLRIESDPPGATIYFDRRDLGSRGRAPKPLAVAEGTYRIIVELPRTSAPMAGPTCRTSTESKSFVGPARSCTAPTP